jgi:hypothetical protein
MFIRREINENITEYCHSLLEEFTAVLFEAPLVFSWGGQALV